MYNKITLCGNLGGDPELKYTRTGKAYCVFSMATTEKWRSKSGDLEEKTSWHKVYVWGGQAEACYEYLEKGAMALVEGRLEYNTYEEDGKTRKLAQINAQNVKFLGKRGQASLPGGQERYHDGAPDFGDDDIPF